MTVLPPIAEIARAASVGDLAAINAVLDTMTSHQDSVLRGRTVARRELGRDPPLPPIDQTEIAKAEGWHCSMNGEPTPPGFERKAPTPKPKPKKKARRK